MCHSRQKHIDVYPRIEFNPRSTAVTTNPNDNSSDEFVSMLWESFEYANVRFSEIFGQIHQGFLDLRFAVKLFELMKLALGPTEPSGYLLAFPIRRNLDKNFSHSLGARNQLNFDGRV